jgi:hypothetical protein
MSLPKCFDILNDGYFDALSLRIHAAGSPVELQALVNEAYAQLSLLQSTIESQIAALGPIEALLISPTDLPGLITWAQNLITSFLGPYFAAYAKLLAQVTALATKVADLEADITAVAALKFPEVEITIPGISIGCRL